MKIISWNVNGLRSAETRFLDFVRDNRPDIILLQEIRALPNQLSIFLREIPDYRVEFNSCQRPGYSGTAIYYRRNLPISFAKPNTGIATLDQEGRSMVCTLDDLTVVNLYAPNGNSGPERLKFKLEFYEAMKTFVREQSARNPKLVIGADMNVAHTELDLYNPKQSQRSSGFLPVERESFTGLLNLGLVDAFRHFQKGGGHYTWWHMRDPLRRQNKGWRYDYFLVSESQMNKITGSSMLRDVYGSDHCPILLEIQA